VPKAVNHSGVYDKHNCPQCNSIPGPRALQSGMLPLDHCDVVGQQVEQVSQFRYLGSLITEDGYCTKEIPSRIEMAKKVFMEKKKLFTGKMNLELKERIMKCLVWSVALYSAEMWTLTQTVRRRLEVFEMWIWRRMEKISWLDKVANEEVLKRVNEYRQILNSVWQRKHRWIGHVLRHNGLLHEITEGRMKGKPTRERRIQMLQDLANDGGFGVLKRAAEDIRGMETQREDVKNLLYSRRLLMSCSRQRCHGFQEGDGDKM